MEYGRFVKQVVKGLQEKVKGAVTVTEVKKNNGVNMEGLLIREKGRNISPIIYLNPYYCSHREGKNVAEIIDDICEICLKHGAEYDFKVDSFRNFEEMKSRIIFRLVNYKMNGALLKEIPHQKYMDLAVVFGCLLYDDGENGQASVLIRNEHLDGWGVSVEEMAKLAFENTPQLLGHRLISMEQIISGLCGDASYKEASALEMAAPEMIVLTNRSRWNGAGCILYPDILKGFADKMDSNFVILPSSIHEVILIPVKESEVPDRESFCRMICEVNETQVEDTEVLSDHPYFYNRATAQISAA